jgi:hypothetical protein
MIVNEKNSSLHDMSPLAFRAGALVEHLTTEMMSLLPFPMLTKPVPSA